jgi:hypothetical protein
MKERAKDVIKAFSRCPHWSVSFAAADARRPFFRQLVSLLDTQPSLTKPKLTLYCSPNDWALWASSEMRKNSRVDKDGRAGYYRRNLLLGNHDYHVFVSQHVETVTVTGGLALLYNSP